MKLTKQQKIKAMETYNAYWENYLNGNVEAMASLLSNKYTQVGSAETEVFFNKKDAVKFLYDTIDQVAGKLEMRNRSIKLEKQSNFLLFHELCDLYAMAEYEWIFYSKFRATTIMEEKKQGWKIIHQHSSFPDARTGEGENIAIDKLAEENRELREAVKRRTVELENKSRELEIEASLERVRSIAMGMRKPADMLDVCKTISTQLQLLGVKEIRNVQTAIFYEQRGTYMNYEFYTKHDKSFITETVFTNNAIHNEFATKMLKGKGEVFITHINGEEVRDWIAYQKTTNVFIDKYLETASSLNYYWFSLGPVALGISTYHPLTEEEIDLFKRFLKVFELAYQRYLDIEQAETQAREAQIEASLERVRAVAMGMNKSDDLLSICEISYKEFKKLGFDNIRNALIHIQYDNQKYFMDYDFSDLTGGAITKIEYGSHPVVEDYLKQIRSAKDAFYQGVIKEDQLEEWKDFRKNSGQIDDPRLDKATALYYYFFSIGIGDIGISTLKSINETQIKILKRFRNVFDLAYRRYNDITLAEAQAREAKIEAALERVRAKAMAMHTSNDLSETMGVLFTELPKLGINSLRCGVVLLSKTSRRGVFYAAATTPESDSFTMIGAGDMAEHPVFMKQYENWLNNENYFTSLSDEGLHSYYKAIFARLSIPYIPKGHEAQTEHGYYFSFSEGMFYAWTEQPYSDDEINILNRFKAIIDLTFRRYLDLQKAEAQAREAQIEAALERVRSRTMGMQKSEELKDVIRVVYEQFVHLKINVDHAGFVVDYTPKGDWHFWIADEQEIPSKITHPYFESVWAHQFNEAKEKGIDFFATNLNFEEKNKFYNELLSYVPGLPEASKDFYLSCPGLAATTVLFDNVSLYIENFSGIPYTEEENNTLMRFGKVFQQTYTRFLDLQKAEAQAREAQIEAALERVRSRSLAMHHTSELQDVINTVHQQFSILNIAITGGVFIAINEENKNEITCWGAGGATDYVERVRFPFLDRPIITGLIGGIHKGPGFFIEEFSYEEKIEFFNHLFKHSPFKDASPERKKELLSRQGGYTRSCIVSKYTSVFIINHHGRKFLEEENNVLIRFGKVFEQSYVRFLDLQKAEAQAREAQIEAALERVRSKAMAMNSSEDLAITVDTFFSELNKLGIIPHRCGVGIVEPETRITDIRATAFTKENVSKKIVGKLKLAGHPVLDKVFENWKLKQEYHPVLRGKEISEYYKVMNPQVTFPDFADDEIQYGHYFQFKEGGVFAWTDKVLTEEDLQIFRRYTSVLSLTYRRYAELKEAEAQAREAKIEASLERVRSKAMAMHSPNDLSETVNIFFKELKTLGIIPIRCGVGQIDGATRTTSLTTTTSSQQGESFQVIGKVKQTGHPVLDGIFEHWKLQKEYHPVLEGEDIKAYYDVMNPQIGYPEYPQGVTQYGNNFFFKEGFVFAWTENQLSEEELIIFRRFTSVLSLTYRRYLDLKEAEERNNIIQAENDRKTKELEEARQLQLSLLPRTLPQLSQFDIAVYMKTATEVGGDYYDFNVQPNGVLNIGIGDATGHGLQAGTMITLMKGFFTADVAKFSPQKFLEHCNRIIKDIRLGRILMSFSHLRFENNNLLISSAGMPPVYYHHKKNNRTEEIIIQGLPLGAMESASYKLVEKQFNSGDTILLLTDGLPEQMNNHKVIFDYSRVLKYFDEIAENAPNEIINRLVQKADDWMDGQKQDDDVTFVVIKVK